MATISQIEQALDRLLSANNDEVRSGLRIEEAIDVVYEAIYARTVPRQPAKVLAFSPAGINGKSKQEAEILGNASIPIDTELSFGRGLLAAGICPDNWLGDGNITRGFRMPDHELHVDGLQAFSDSKHRARLPQLAMNAYSRITQHRRLADHQAADLLAVSPST